MVERMIARSNNGQSWRRSYGQRVKAQQTRSVNEYIRLLSNGAGDEHSAETIEAPPAPTFKTVGEKWEAERREAEALQRYSSELSTASMNDCNTFGLMGTPRVDNKRTAIAASVSSSPDDSIIPDNPAQQQVRNLTQLLMTVKFATTLNASLERMSALSDKVQGNDTFSQVLSFMGKMIEGDTTTSDDVVAALDRLADAINNTTANAYAKQFKDGCQIRIPESVNEVAMEAGVRGIQAFIGKDREQMLREFDDYATTMRTLKLEQRIATQAWFIHHTPVIDPAGNIQRFEEAS